MSTASAAMEEICHSAQKDNLHLVSGELHKGQPENLPWISTNERTEQPHDEPIEEVEYKNYFSAPRFLLC